MHLSVKMFLVGMLFIAQQPCAAQSKKDIKLVKRAFANYKKALGQGNGVEAAKGVDRNTLSYYNNLLKRSIYADSAEVQNLDFIDKLMVLTVRHKIPAGEIFQLERRDFFTYAVEKGIVAKTLAAGAEIGKVYIDGNAAKGQLVSLGEVSPLYFYFNKEAGTWKLDLTPLFPLINKGFKEMLVQNGTTESEYIFTALQNLTGKPASREIWNALK
jgi:hypothetical protein